MVWAGHVECTYESPLIHNSFSQYCTWVQTFPVNVRLYLSKRLSTLHFAHKQAYNTPVLVMCVCRLFVTSEYTSHEEREECLAAFYSRTPFPLMENEFPVYLIHKSSRLFPVRN
jgi:hypothetical protein